MTHEKKGPVGAVESTSSAGPLRILGVDPGLTRCGFGVVEMSGNRKAHYIDAGVAGTQAADSLDTRVLHIQRAMQGWIDTYRPDVMAIERVFAQESVNTVIGTAHASGVVIATAAAAGIPVAWHTPSEVKAAVTGSGRADKKSVGRMVARILELEEVPKPADAADALALAICHGWRSGIIGTGINMGTGVQTHQGSIPAGATSGAMTPAQRAWKMAEERSRRSR
ncbi:crossover junction endodeoxyribonuclease RuvC [Kocuria sp. TGY1127_2]|uniref:crossover junction endodeoxyribonuclease RuvC n=1 Tax=Kocuria sp. TGY1127_2 TaxID=2711328 RepID=UPI0015BEA3B2|nr:crossover junction endodeoxyribonuclease RuvC [Kocuria sp. TGY1127_2]